MRRYKNGVRIRPPIIRKEVEYALGVSERTAPPLEGGVLVVTSMNDGTHSKGSFHYKDKAWDIRVQSSDVSLPGNVLANAHDDRVRIARNWVERINAAMDADLTSYQADDFDILVETDTYFDERGAGHFIVHIHGEYDIRHADRGPGPIDRRQ